MMVVPTSTSMVALTEFAHHRGRALARGIWPWPTRDARLGHQPCAAPPRASRWSARGCAGRNLAGAASSRVITSRQAILARGDIRLDRLPVLGGCWMTRVADAGQGHVQGARDRSRGEREHIDGHAQRLELLLLQHPEALLLVDHHQAEFVELHVALQEPVRADDDVDFRRCAARSRVGDVGLAAEARQPRQVTGKAQTLAEGQECCWASTVVGTSRRPGDPRITALKAARSASSVLPKPTSPQTSGPSGARTHVALDLVEHELLVRRLLVRERRFELTLPGAVGAKGVTMSHLTP